DPLRRRGHIHLGGAEMAGFRVVLGGGAVHFRRLAKQYRHGQVHRYAGEVTVVELEGLVGGGLPHHRIGAALPLADGLKHRQVLGAHRDYIALLGLVAPDFHGRHAGLVAGHLAQLESAAAAAVLDQLGDGVGQATGAHVVDKGNGVGVAELPALVDHLLTAAFDLRVLALYRGEIQLFGTGARGHRRGRTAPQADQHRRPPQHHQPAAWGKGVLVDMLLTDIAVATGDHDGLVVAAALAVKIQLETAEVAAQVGAAKLVVEGGPADGTLDHDVQGGDDALRLAVVGLPGLGVIRDAQVGDTEAGEPHLGLGAP